MRKYHQGKFQNMEHVGIRSARDRGRYSYWPFQIPLRGWRDVILRTYGAFRDNNTGLIAAGIAFYFFLAIFPAIAVMISVYGLIADPAMISDQINLLANILPAEVIDLLTGQAFKIVSSDDGALSLGLMISLLLTLFASSKGAKALISALNISYKQVETRNLLKLNLLAMGLTFFVVIMALIALGAVAILPAAIQILNLGGISEQLMLARWPFLAFIGLIVLQTLYRYGPDRKHAKWRWLSLGSVLAALIWLAVSALFSWYVSSFGKYNETYGALGAVAVLMMWLWLSSVALLIGAEFDASLELQTSRDSTIGPDKPIGQRGAYVADTIGDVP